jgi:hypothetical protein
VVTVSSHHEAELISRAQQAGQVVTKFGTTGGDSLSINGVRITLSEIEKAYTATIPALFA